MDGSVCVRLYVVAWCVDVSVCVHVCVLRFLIIHLIRKSVTTTDQIYFA